MSGEQKSNGGPEANKEASARAEAWELVARAPGWEYLDFSDDNGEKPVINSATGKERTFSEYDLYPRQKGQSNEEYGAMLKEQHEKTAQSIEGKIESNAAPTVDYVPKYTAEEKEAIMTSLPPSERATLEAFKEKTNRYVADEKITQENADKMFERKLENAAIDDMGRQTIGSKEEQERLEEHWRKLENPAPAPEPKAEVAPEPTSAEEEFKKKLDDANKKIDRMMSREFNPISEEKAKELRQRVEADLKSKMEAKLRLETAYKNIDNLVQIGQIDEEQAAQYKAQIEEKYKIEDEFQDKMENEAKANEEARLRAEEEAKRRMEAAAEARAKMDEEARAKMDEEARAQMGDDAKRQMDDDAAKNQGKAPKETAGLYAINAEALLDKKQILAETVDKVMEKEISSAHGIKKLFVKLFKNQYRKRIERELQEGDRDEYNFAIRGRRVNICRVYGKLVPECIDDIRKEKGKDDMLEKADEASTKLVKEAIQEFVEKVNKEGIKSTTKQKEVFEEIMKAKRGGAKQEGVAVDNYAKVALQALELTHHGAAMDKVMEGFKLINVRPKTEREMERTKELEEVAKLIRDSEELLGGKEGINIIMSGEASEQDTAPDGRFRKWWDSLSGDGKTAAIQIFKKITETNKERIMNDEETIKQGGAIMSWLKAEAEANAS